MNLHLSGKVVSAAHTAVQRHLQWVFRVTTRKPGVVFAACCLSFLISCLAITRIHFEADIFKMFPQKGPLSLFLDTMQWTGSSGNAYFLLEGDKDTLIEEAEVFAGKLRELRVDGSAAFKSVKHRVFDGGEAKPFTDFVAYAVTRPQLFVAPEDTPSYLQLLSPPKMEQSLRKATTELASPGALKELVAADPLYLRNLILPRLKKASESLNLDPLSPYLLSRDGKVLIIIGEPARPVTDIMFARKLVAGINEARKGAHISISCAGAHLSAVTDEAIMKKNVIEGVFLSLAIVLSLFYLSYRRFLPTLLIPVILCFGVVFSVAAGGIVYPTMSVISFAFASLIIGIGTDYSIHLYDRFHFERFSGRSSYEALELAVVDTGHALFTAGMTTAFPFLALMVSDVRALAELGLLVGLGVIFSLYATLFFLPPLLLFMERRFPLKEYRPLPGFGFGLIWRLTYFHPRRTLAICLAVTMFLLVCATGISFESELKNLQPRSSEAFLAQQKLEQHLSISPKEMIVAVEGNELAEVMSKGSRVAALAERYRAQDELVAYSSLLRVINDADTQGEVIRQLAAWPHSAGLRGEIDRALAQEGFASEPFATYVKGLSELSDSRAIPVSEGIEHLAASPFRGIVERHLAHTADGYHLLTYLNYRGSEFRQDAFLSELKTAAPGSRATSIDLVSRQLTESVKQSFIWAVLIGAIMVFFLLVSHFSSLTGILCSLFPVTAGAIAMLGVMPLAGMSLNFMNVMVLVTILGMGSDYGLHVAHRVRNCAREEYQARFVQSGRAVFLSGLTTIAGFGSLALTDYGAMASIGWATNVGVAATTLFTLAAVPAFISLIGNKG
ncbi:RND family transporter [Geobacter sp. SVR]|uniref:efflux RND transporter permease subunit n=1 Tax=Geobacter sp. SVR TaxID=2495594 RepID=UPI00143EF812|nr:MMPL family transporter [Geobacter sp. SVR]BCS54262.1 exporter [Geobacter sp. SVR]GCF85880.1 exporter [Geobacter sp. SVR]